MTNETTTDIMTIARTIGIDPDALKLEPDGSVGFTLVTPSEGQLIHARLLRSGYKPSSAFCAALARRGDHADHDYLAG